MVRKSRTIAFLAAVFALAGPGAAQTGPFDAHAYVDRAIELVRGNALTSEIVDWPAVTAEMHRRADGAHDAFGVYPALAYLIEELHDGHSFIQLDDAHSEAYRAANGRPFEVAFHKPPAETHFFRRPAGSKDVEAGDSEVRWIVVPSFSGDAAESKAFVAKLSGLITAAPAVCGYVLDFRGNGGGNMWPMLAGISPLLSNRALGSFVSRNERDIVFHRDGAVGMRIGEKEQILSASEGSRSGPGLQSVPVAVLTDGGSGSSGEIVPIMLNGRPHTRFIGTPTFGASTSTEGFLLPDGTNLVIATSRVADRSGKSYPDGLSPDLVGKYDPRTGRDDPLIAARRWLAQQASCRKR